MVRFPNQAPSKTAAHWTKSKKENWTNHSRGIQTLTCSWPQYRLQFFWILLLTVLYCKNGSLQDMKLLLLKRHSIYFCSNFCVFISKAVTMCTTFKTPFFFFSLSLCFICEQSFTFLYAEYWAPKKL